MNFITLKDPSVLGEKHPTYGWSVWSETDSDFPVMFNVMDETKLLPDIRVAYEEALLKTSSKGKQYLRLKKVRFEDDPVKQEGRIPFTEKPAPTFNASTADLKEAENKYLKDPTDIPGRIIIELLKYYDVQSLYNSPKYTNMINLAQSINDDTMAMIRGNRSGQGDNSENLSSSPSAKEVERPAAGPLKSVWEERKKLPKAVSWNEEDIPVNDDYPPEEP